MQQHPCFCELWPVLGWMFSLLPCIYSPPALMDVVPGRVTLRAGLSSAGCSARSWRTPALWLHRRVPEGWRVTRQSCLDQGAEVCARGSTSAGFPQPTRWQTRKSFALRSLLQCQGRGWRCCCYYHHYVLPGPSAPAATGCRSSAIIYISSSFV